jgi:cell division protein FtsL
MIVEMLFYMTIGMVVGMIASPILMKAIKVLRQRRRVSKLLKEISELQRTDRLHEKQQLL